MTYDLAEILGPMRRQVSDPAGERSGRWTGQGSYGEGPNGEGSGRSTGEGPNGEESGR